MNTRVTRESEGWVVCEVPVVSSVLGLLGLHIEEEKVDLIETNTVAHASLPFEVDTVTHPRKHRVRRN